MNVHSTSLNIPGPAGSLEVVRDVPQGMPPPAPCGVAVIAHPHPVFGATLHNKVVQTLARSFVASGWVALRLNFRGVGSSQGQYDEGRGEVADMLAVVAQLAPTGPLVIAGFSFGAYVCVQVGHALAGTRPVHAQVLVGLAAGRFAVPPLLPDWHDRTLVLHAQDDEVVPFSAVMGWAQPQALPVLTLPVGGHFLHGRLPLLKSIVLRHLRGCGTT